MASQMLLRARGLEDRWFTGTPQRTYFETKSEPRVNRSRESFELPFDNQPVYGQTGRCTVPPKGDFLTGLTLRTVLPAIYPTSQGEYVYPKPSSDVGASVYVNMGITFAVADGVTLTANTTGNHYFSVGAQVTLVDAKTYTGSGFLIYDLDGTYTISSIPTANSFTCVTTNAGTCTTGTVTTVGIACADIVSYFSTQNSNLWINYIVSPISVLYNQNFQFSSNIYPSISFINSADAAFWGFDARQGLTYTFTSNLVTPPWTLTQSGWITGFLPPSLSTYVDSVAHKLCKAVRIKIGKQTIKEFTGEYIELQNDLWVPYENKAILKLLNGTLDQTQSVASREYYVRIPMGTHEYPLCALTQQQLSISIDFEEYSALSDNLNAGTGDFLNSSSYVVYDASNRILNGQPMNVQTAFSYQQYIFIVTYTGNLIIYDTAQSITDSASYQVITALAGSTSLFQQFCVLSGTLYIGLANGQLISGNLNELIQKNTSSFVLNNYSPTFGSLTGTLIADFRYLYYAVSNTVNSNVYLTQYDTTKSFTNSTSYTSFDFTKDVNSSVTSLNQIISNSSNIYIIPNISSLLYTHTLGLNFSTQWSSVNYSSYGTNVSTGVLIGSTFYFILDSFNILKYNGSVFSKITTGFSIGTGLKNLLAVGKYIYASSNSVSISTVVRINTLDNCSYQYYSSTGSTAPITFDGSAPEIFANGPRFVYMFTNDPSQLTNPLFVQRFDPYAPNTTFKSSIIADYESLPSGVPKPDKALVPITQTQKVTDMNYMDIRGPVKELFITGASLSTNVFQYSNLTNQSTLALTAGEQILTDDVGTRTFLKTIQAFETHTSMPFRNVSVIPFEFDPESETPNGTVNFSRIRDQVFNGDARTIWARTYNILKIQGGIGGLMFNS
jgi:hypothetical protein